MSRFAMEPDIIDLATQLGLGGAADPVVAILDSCRRRIDRWVAEVGGISSIERLEALVAGKLQMFFEEIRSEADFARIKDVYAAGKRDAVFAAMKMKFEDEGNPTYGALVRRKNVADDAPDRYVAVIDCRGDKLHRRFFTRWHEIAHRLTTHADLDEPVYRSEHDPLEQMMDRVASHVGFYEPLFGPAFDREMVGRSKLTFEVVELIRRRAFPEASFQSALVACHRRLAEPAVYLEASEAFKAEDRREINRGRQWLIEDLRPVPELRAVKVFPNDAAKLKGLFIIPKMRIPESSQVHRIFCDDTLASGVTSENLGQWEHSGGKRLADQDVWVEARKARDRVIALVQAIPVGTDL